MRSQTSRDTDYLEHIANRIARIERATSGVDFAGFRGNEDLQAAIERYIEVIGEAAGKLSQHSRDLAPDVPWSQVIGARNVIVHGYAEIEPDRIWDIVRNHLPSLRVAVGRLRQLLNEKEPDRREDPGR
ncbi:MAG: HepT-like ribonuclease domain-containing protein [Bryobacteraceae bacterium]